MSTGPQFNLEHEVTYGAVEQVSPLVQRVTCENPSKFTFLGTGTYIIGDRDVAVIDPGPDSASRTSAPSISSTPAALAAFASARTAG